MMDGQRRLRILANRPATWHVADITVRRSTQLAAACALVGALVPATAGAGSYQVAVCGSGPFTSSAVPAAPFTLSGACGGSGVGVTVAAAATNGAAASWTLAAPPGTTLRTVVARRWLGRLDARWDASVRTAEGTLLDTCTPDPDDDSCTKGSSSGLSSAITYAGLRTAALSLGVRCTATRCPGPSNGFPAAWVNLYSAQVTVDDPDAPAVTPAAPAGWVHGVAGVPVAAADASGIASLGLRAGTTPLARVDQACDFSRMRPCPPTGQATLPVDTATLPDGVQTLEALATDAAGQLRAAPFALRVDQHAPAAPLDLTARRLADGTYTVSWRNPDQGAAAPIAAATAVVCTPVCAAAVRTAGDGVQRLDGVALTASATLRVWLEDAAGNADPANAAVLSPDTALGSPRAVDTLPPLLTTAATSPRLKLGRATRAGATLTASGTIARAATASVIAELRASRTGKVLVRVRTRPRSGRWALKLHLTAALRRASGVYLTVRFAGQATYRSAFVVRRVAR